MFVYGTRAVKNLKGQGTFFCPVCQSGTRYKHYNLKKCAHVYFLPVADLSSGGVNYIKCSRCQQKFTEDCLERSLENEQNLQTAMNLAMLKGMIRIMAADGKMEKDEFESICTIYQKRTGNESAVAVLHVLVQMQNMDKNGMKEDFRFLVPFLQEHDKEQVLEAMVAVSLADGELDRSEATLLQEVGSVLGVPLQRTKAILKEEYNRRDRNKEEAQQQQHQISMAISATPY